MAQAKVKDFFSTKKRHDHDHHAAKRRKIESKESLDLCPKGGISSFSSVNKGIEIKSRSSCVAPETSKSVTPELTPSRLRSRTSCKQLTVHSSSSNSISRTRRNQKSKKTNHQLGPNSQLKLTDMFLSQSSKTEENETESANEAEKTTVEQFEEKTRSRSRSKSTELEPTGFFTVTEEVTSFVDDHNRDLSQVGLRTPRKRLIATEISETSQGPKARKNKTATRKLSPTSDVTTDDSKLESAKKKLDLPEPAEDNTADAGHSFNKTNSFSGESCSAPVDKSCLLALVDDLASQPNAISPVPGTPERKESPEPSVETASPKLQDLTEKLKALSKMNGKALKNRLKQSGKLKDLKEKSRELGSALEVKKPTPKSVVLGEESEQEKSNKSAPLPAHQRFEHLTTEGVPTLSLPFSYRVVESTFHAMDTVVSMMHNRSEMCTFSKLKAAVQNITKRNFEQKSMGQIKTVLPDAYVFRQETNVPAFGKKKSSGYQLTVEANLPEEDENAIGTQVLKNSEGKPMFSASLILTRKKAFKNNLIARVKEIHKAYLAGLSPPIIIPNDKVTRWHPRFPLDKVEEIPTSDLPQPPEVAVYTTARDVLNRHKGNINPKVEEALAKVALQSEKANKQTPEKTSNNTSTPEKVSSNKPFSSVSGSQTATTSSLKGIPPALLAKIRAKEALKMQEALTRDPVEDNKTKMMAHLPEMIRILRSYFVTEKKPAIPLEAVYKKLEDSYRSGISRKDVEKHVDLLKELAPEVVTIVQVKQGKYLKLDKNINTQEVANRILNLVKSRQ